MFTKFSPNLTSCLKQRKMKTTKANVKKITKYFGFSKLLDALYLTSGLRVKKKMKKRLMTQCPRLVKTTPINKTVLHFPESPQGKTLIAPCCMSNF